LVFLRRFRTVSGWTGILYVYVYEGVATSPWVGQAEKPVVNPLQPEFAFNIPVRAVSLGDPPTEMAAGLKAEDK
jgi:hypothetical protein